jgi:hypothetical protein
LAGALVEVGVGASGVGFVDSVGMTVGNGVEGGCGVGVRFRATGRLERPQARFDIPRRARDNNLIIFFMSIDYLIGRWSFLFVLFVDNPWTIGTSRKFPLAHGFKKAVTSSGACISIWGRI